jgi:uncharacterized protein (TIGR03790 family)
MNKVLFTLAMVAALTATRLQASENPATVLVVYRINCEDYDRDGTGDSEQIARYYASRRGIPLENLLGVRVDFAGGADPFDKFLAWPWDAWRKSLVKALCEKLDKLGRTKILYIVTTFGMPLRVEIPNAKVALSADTALARPFRITEDGVHYARYYDLTRANRYGMERFDAFRARHAATDPANDIGYIVSRLDGVSTASVKAIVDGALYADTYQVDGFAYVDTRMGAYSGEELREWQASAIYGSYADIDKGVGASRLWYEAAKLKVRQQPDDEAIGDSKPGLKFTGGTPAGEAARALLYAGWYNYGKYNPVWDWLPGSVACDFDSASLFAPNVFMGSFGGMALFNGASGAVGCFGEPQSSGHPQPDVLMAYYTRGFNFGEAAWLSMPIRPFVDFAIGDPLMNPFGRGRSPDDGISPLVVTLSKDGDTLHARVTMAGKLEIARARMVVAEKKDDALLTPPKRQDGRYQREHLLGAPVPKTTPAWVGVVATDPAGNTVRVWTEWKG